MTTTRRLLMKMKLMMMVKMMMMVIKQKQKSCHRSVAKLLYNRLECYLILYKHCDNTWCVEISNISSSQICVLLEHCSAWQGDGKVNLIVKGLLPQILQWSIETAEDSIEVAMLMKMMFDDKLYSDSLMPKDWWRHFGARGYDIWQLLSIKENICAERPRKSYALQDAKK